MNDDLTTLDGLVDIEPPVTPILHVLENTALDIAFSALLITGLLIAITFILWKHYFSSKEKARRKIQQLHKKFSTQKINHHDVALQLSKLLREYLGLGKTLKRADFPEALASHKTRWETFTERLSIACYSLSLQKKEHGPENIAVLFDDAYFWLKTWPDRQ